MTISKDTDKALEQITNGLYDLLEIWLENQNILEEANGKCETNFASCFNYSLDELLAEVQGFRYEIVQNLTSTKE